jgi:hypothetical protein
MTMHHRSRISFVAATAMLGASFFVAGSIDSHARAAHLAPALRSVAAAALAAADNAFASEKGKFRILVDGKQVGKEEFEISQVNRDWIAKGSSEIQLPQGASHVTGTLALRPDGTPVRYEWSTAGAKKAGAAIEFNGSVATIQLHLENARPFTQQFTFESPRVAVLDNNLYHQYAILARLYDWAKKGPQVLSVLVPQEMTPGNVTVESLGKTEGKFEELRVKTDDLELSLFLDNMKLVRIVVPRANAEILRD